MKWTQIAEWYNHCKQKLHVTHQLFQSFAFKYLMAATVTVKLLVSSCRVLTC